MKNIVAIVGRPNVGKSTLFNRLTQTRDAIVEPVSGTTRDRHYGKVEWCGRQFSIIDTGGYLEGSDDVFEKEIRKQVEFAIEEAQLILFMVDVEEGLSELDEDIARILRKSRKPVLLAANKVDTSLKNLQAAEFYRLGFGEMFNISSSSGSGTGELLDAILDKLPVLAEEEEGVHIPRLAFVGKPNVGKSSIINLFLGADRNIVTPVSGTTRDAIDTRYNAFGFDFILTDTAGLRRRTKIDNDIEFYSTLRTERAIENADVCLLMIDALEGVQKQDLAIYYTIVKHHKGVVILINKWDLVDKTTNTLEEYRQMVKEQLAPFNDVPIIFTSVLEKQRVHKALQTAVEVYKNKMQKIPTSKLNELILPEIEKFPPPMYKGKIVNIKYIQQIPTHSLSFAFYCNLPQYIKEPYKRFLENKLRMYFQLTGVPINIFFRQK